MATQDNFLTFHNQLLAICTHRTCIYSPKAEIHIYHVVLLYMSEWSFWRSFHHLFVIPESPPFITLLYFVNKTKFYFPNIIVNVNFLIPFLHRRELCISIVFIFGFVYYLLICCYLWINFTFLKASINKKGKPGKVK